jgi:hypothetical protein
MLSWNTIRIDKGFYDLELVVNISSKNKNIFFKTKNDVCSFLGINLIKNENLIKKIIKH